MNKIIEVFFPIFVKAKIHNNIVYNISLSMEKKEDFISFKEFYEKFKDKIDVVGDEVPHIRIWLINFEIVHIYCENDKFYFNENFKFNYNLIK